MATSDRDIRNHAAFIWSVADKLRGVYKQSEYGRVILPLVVLRRLDCVLEETKNAVLQRNAALKGRVENVGPVLESVTGVDFFNTSLLDLRRVLDDPGNVASHLRTYIAGFSPEVRDVFDKFGLDPHITRLERANLLYLVVSQFAEIDLHPNAVSNLEMGYLYEELLRRFSELSNEEAGHHFTPREVIRLMVNLLFIEDDDVLHKRGIVKTLFDPACGTGGMLSVAEHHLRDLNPDARLAVFGQELNEQTFAVCRSDMLLKGQGGESHRPGQLIRRRRSPRPHLRLPAREPAVRGRVEVGRAHGQGRARAGRVPRPFRRRPAGDQRRQLPLPPAHDLEDEAGHGGRLARRDRLQRLAALHGRRRLGAVRDPPLDHRERLARGGRRAARPALLQHRDLDLLLVVTNRRSTSGACRAAGRRSASTLGCWRSCSPRLRPKTRCATSSAGSRSGEPKRT